MPNTKPDRSPLRLAGHRPPPSPRPILRDIFQFSARCRIPDRSKSADQTAAAGASACRSSPGATTLHPSEHTAGTAAWVPPSAPTPREHDHDPDDSARLHIPHPPNICLDFWTTADQAINNRPNPSEITGRHTTQPKRSLTDADPSRVGISADGFIATPDGMSALAAMPSFQPGVSRGTQNLDAVVMGRNTFLPALGAPRWPWPGLQIYVLTSRPLPPADTRRWRNLTRRASGASARQKAGSRTVASWPPLRARTVRRGRPRAAGDLGGTAGRGWHPVRWRGR